MSGLLKCLPKKTHKSEEKMVEGLVSIDSLLLW